MNCLRVETSIGDSLFSLRDSNNTPQFIIIVNSMPTNGKRTCHTIREILSPDGYICSKLIRNYYTQHLIDFIYHNDIRVSNTMGNPLRQFDITFINNELYDVKTLYMYDGLVVKHDFTDTSNTNLRYLPDNMTVHGRFSVENTYLEYIPENLTVYGTFNVVNTKVSYIPDSICIKDMMLINSTNITKIGNVDVYSICANDCNIVEVADGCHFYDFIAQNTSLNHIPYNFYIDNTFIINYSTLEETLTYEEILYIIRSRGGYVKKPTTNPDLVNSV